MNNIPWVEKYRPTYFDNIILDSLNKNLFENIIKKKYFPNMLFYGQPGTGKTTTIINIVNLFLNNIGNQFNESIIHLNASDERGIDIIRNQINIFVKSNHLFNKQLKIIILDEVDYMTKNAQQALKNILQNTYENVRFCLICNYISKIDNSLKNEFVCIRFNKLPKLHIINFVKTICDKESIIINNDTIEKIHNLYKNDIRTIINYIQLNNHNNIINENIYNNILLLIKQHLISENQFIDYIHNISITYNIDKIEIILRLFNYFIYTDFSIFVNSNSNSNSNSNYNSNSNSNSNYTLMFKYFIELKLNNISYNKFLNKIEYVIHNINLVNVFIILKYIWWNF